MTALAGLDAKSKDKAAPFLQKLFAIVEDPGTDDVISWKTDDLANPDSFIVWKPDKLATEILPQFFKHNNFCSFIRQLNTYGFRKVDPAQWQFKNELFQKGHRELLAHIQRRKSVKRGHKKRGVDAENIIRTEDEEDDDDDSPITGPIPVVVPTSRGPSSSAVPPPALPSAMPSSAPPIVGAPPELYAKHIPSNSIYSKPISAPVTADSILRSLPLHQPPGELSPKHSPVSPGNGSSGVSLEAWRSERDALYREMSQKEQRQQTVLEYMVGEVRELKNQLRNSEENYRKLLDFVVTLFVRGQSQTGLRDLLRGTAMHTLHAKDVKSEGNGTGGGLGAGLFEQHMNALLQSYSGGAGGETQPQGNGHGPVAMATGGSNGTPEYNYYNTPGTSYHETNPATSVSTPGTGANNYLSLDPATFDMSSAYPYPHPSSSVSTPSYGGTSGYPGSLANSAGGLFAPGEIEELAHKLEMLSPDIVEGSAVPTDALPMPGMGPRGFGGQQPLWP